MRHRCAQSRIGPGTPSSIRLFGPGVIDRGDEGGKKKGPPRGEQCGKDINGHAAFDAPSRGVYASPLRYGGQQRAPGQGPRAVSYAGRTLSARRSSRMSARWTSAFLMLAISDQTDLCRQVAPFRVGLAVPSRPEFAGFGDGSSEGFKKTSLATAILFGVMAHLPNHAQSRTTGVPARGSLVVVPRNHRMTVDQAAPAVVRQGQLQWRSAAQCTDRDQCFVPSLLVQACNSSLAVPPMPVVCIPIEQQSRPRKAHRYGKRGLAAAQFLDHGRFAAADSMMTRTRSSCRSAFGAFSIARNRGRQRLDCLPRTHFSGRFIILVQTARCLLQQVDGHHSVTVKGGRGPFDPVRTTLVAPRLRR